jgi:hypothetical protein
MLASQVVTTRVLPQIDPANPRSVEHGTPLAALDPLEAKGGLSLKLTVGAAVALLLAVGVCVYFVKRTDSVAELILPITPASSLVTPGSPMEQRTSQVRAVEAAEPSSGLVAAASATQPMDVTSAVGGQSATPVDKPPPDGSAAQAALKSDTSVESVRPPTQPTFQRSPSKEAIANPPVRRPVAVVPPQLIEPRSNQAVPAPVPLPAAPPPPVAATPELRQLPSEVVERPRDPDWYMTLKSELAHCSGKGNFLTRSFCEQKAKLRFCGQGNHWGSVPECVQPASSQNGG